MKELKELTSLNKEDRQWLKSQNHLIENILKRRLRITDLWDQSDYAITNWMLLLTSMNQEEEFRIAGELLCWKGLIVRDSARVQCIQSIDQKAFQFCMKKFGASSCPALIFSDDVEMNNFIIIGPQILTRLGKEKGGIQKLLIKMHTAVANGGSLETIKKELKTESFWAGVKLIYSEMKDFLTFSISAKTDI
jgi:hypothetical protein